MIFSSSRRREGQLSSQLVSADADEQEGEPAEHDVGADALLLAVVDGAQVDDLLHVPPAALDLGELLVAEGDVRR